MIFFYHTKHEKREFFFFFFIKKNGMLGFIKLNKNLYMILNTLNT